MKNENERLLKAIGDIDGKYVKEAMPKEEHRPYRFVNTGAKRALLAMAVVMLLLITMVFSVSALREPVVEFIAEIYHMFFPGDKPEYLYELETTRYLQEGETGPTTAVWQGSGRTDKAAGFPGYTWGWVSVDGLEVRTEYAKYAPGVKEIRVIVTNNTGKEFVCASGGNFTLQYWDGYGWHLCPIPPFWNFIPHPDPDVLFETLPPGQTQAVSSMWGWEPPVEGFYRITIMAREIKEEYNDPDHIHMQAVFEISSSSTPKLTQKLAEELITIQHKIITEESYYPPIPIVRQEEPMVTEPFRPIEETPFSSRDVVQMEQGFHAVEDYVRCMPAQRYKYSAQGDAVYIYFYGQKTDKEAFLCLRTHGWVDGVVEGETESFDVLPERFLVTPAEIYSLKFAAEGNVIQPPRGIQIGDPESKIFGSYPDHRRAGREDTLYDVTAIYPWAKPEQSVTRNGSFVGGRKDAQGNWVFLCADEHSQDTSAVPLDWFNPLRLEYTIKDGKVAGITFSRYSGESYLINKERYYL